MIKLLSGSTRNRTNSCADQTVLDVFLLCDEFLTVEISLKTQYPVQIIASSSAVIHAIASPHIKNYLLHIIPLTAPAQHAYPEIIILKSRKILITSGAKNRFLTEHHTWMIERISLLRILQDFFRSTRKHSQPVHISRFSDKFLQSTTHQIISVSLYDTELSLTAIWSCLLYTSPSPRD